MTEGTRERLEYLRSQIRAECISYSERIELQGLATEIEAGDVELLEWAGVPEFPEDKEMSVQDAWSRIQDVLDGEEGLSDEDCEAADIVAAFIRTTTHGRTR